jgi:hypothetical protein
VFYLFWYPRLWLAYSGWPHYRGYGTLARHLRYAARTSRRLARALFHGMLRYGARLERKQAFMFRIVDVGLELFAMVSTVVRATRRGPRDPHGVELADRFARDARRFIDDKLRDLWSNDDRVHVRVANELLEGRFLWLEQGTMGVPFEVAELEPETMEQYFAHAHQGMNRPPQGGSARLSPVAVR